MATTTAIASPWVPPTSRSSCSPTPTAAWPTAGCGRPSRPPERLPRTPAARRLRRRFAGPPGRAAPAGAASSSPIYLADQAARASTFGLESWLATPTGVPQDQAPARIYRQLVPRLFPPLHRRRLGGNAGAPPCTTFPGTSSAAPSGGRSWTGCTGATRPAAARAGQPTASRPGLTRRRIRFDRREPERQGEWFLAGTEMAVVRQAQASQLAHRLPGRGQHPRPRPRHPPSRQRCLQLSGEARPGWRWRIDKSRPNPPPADPRLPNPGKHRLALLDRSGRNWKTSDSSAGVKGGAGGKRDLEGTGAPRAGLGQCGATPGRWSGTTPPSADSFPYPNAHAV